MSRKPTDFAQLKIRMREALRARIEAAAKKQGHSLNTEMVKQLERKIDREDLLTDVLSLAYGREAAALLMGTARVMVTTGREAAFSRGGIKQAENWFNDPDGYDQGVKAAIAFLEAARPRGKRQDIDLRWVEQHFRADANFAERHAQYEKERPFLIAAELIKAIKGKSGKNLPWLRDDAPKIRAMLGPIVQRLKVPKPANETDGGDNE